MSYAITPIESITDLSIHWWNGTQFIYGGQVSLDTHLPDSVFWGRIWEPVLGEQTYTSGPFEDSGANFDFALGKTSSHAWLPYDSQTPTSILHANLSGTGHVSPVYLQTFAVFPVSDTMFIVFTAQGGEFDWHDVDTPGLSLGGSGFLSLEIATGFWVVNFADPDVTISAPCTNYWNSSVTPYTSGVPGSPVVTTGGIPWAPGPWVLDDSSHLRIIDVQGRGDMVLEFSEKSISIVSHPTPRVAVDGFTDNTFGDVIYGYNGFDSLLYGASTPYAVRPNVDCWFAPLHTYDGTGPALVKVVSGGERTSVVLSDLSKTVFTPTSVAKLGSDWVSIAGYEYPISTVVADTSVADVTNWCSYDVQLSGDAWVVNRTALTVIGAPVNSDGFYIYQIVDPVDDSFDGAVVVRRTSFYSSGSSDDGGGSFVPPSNELVDGGDILVYEINLFTYPGLTVPLGEWTQVAIAGD